MAHVAYFWPEHVETEYRVMYEEDFRSDLIVKMSFPLSDDLKIVFSAKGKQNKTLAAIDDGIEIYGDAALVSESRPVDVAIVEEAKQLILKEREIRLKYREVVKKHTAKYRTQTDSQPQAQPA